MHKLYIDVTQLIHWPGNVTGIPRVMDELSRRFAKEKNVELVLWNPTQKYYHLIDKEKSLDDRGKRIHYVPDDLHVKRPTLERALNVSYKILNRLSTYGLPTEILKNRLRTSPVANACTPKMEKGDVLFILWGEQHSDDFIGHIKQIKNDGAKLVQISYDMLPLVTPQYSGHSTHAMRKYTSEIFPLCDLVFAISESAKNDLKNWMEEYCLELPRIEVFRLGDDFKAKKAHKPSDPAFIKSGLKGDDYILCVGTVEARKNHTLLYYVYKLAKTKSIELPKLVIAGRKGWRTENIIELINDDPDVKNSFVLLHNVSDEELVWLYQNSRHGILASFYEGWGLQVAESAYYEKPFLASETSSIPEVAGSMIDYFNPNSTDECLAAIQSYMDEHVFTKAKERIKTYKVTTWDNTFKQVTNKLNEL